MWNVRGTQHAIKNLESGFSSWGPKTSFVDSESVLVKNIFLPWKWLHTSIMSSFNRANRYAQNKKALGLLKWGHGLWSKNILLYFKGCDTPAVTIQLSHSFQCQHWNGADRAGWHCFWCEMNSTIYCTGILWKALEARVIWEGRIRGTRWNFLFHKLQTRNHESTQSSGNTCRLWIIFRKFYIPPIYNALLILLKKEQFLKYFFEDSEDIQQQ